MKMRLILLVHPPSLASESMPRFADMIMRGMMARGHEVEKWTSPNKFGYLPIRSSFARKWLGYADQFLVYSWQLRKLVDKQPENTLFVFTDQALGMWVPRLAHRPNVIHCHDFIALRSSLGMLPENPTSWTGRHYQRLIRQGFSRGGAFISVSKKTREDLHCFLGYVPKISEAVYNGLNYSFQPMELEKRIPLLKKTGTETLNHGFILHVGGNFWYKNRQGVLYIYRAYAMTCPNPPPLWMIGQPPTDQLLKLAASIPKPGKVHFLSGLTNEQVNAAYAHARVLLFPSLEEGFGWPIVEAMASNCPVITTNTAPMVEVAGGSARLIPRMPIGKIEQESWAKYGAAELGAMINLSTDDRERILEQGRLNADRFDAETALTTYERVYSQILLNPL